MARRRLGGRKAAGARVSAAAAAAVLLLGVAIALLTLARAPQDGGVQASVDDVVAAPAQGVAAAVSPVDDAWRHIADLWNAPQRIAALERENAELRRWQAMALALAERNERYEALLKAPPDGLAETLDPRAGVAARMILDSAGPFRRTALVQAGADHGVRRGFVAVSDHGLVGRVVLVGRTTARVLMLDDFNSRVPVMGQTSRIRAVLAGATGQSPRLNGPIVLGEPRLEYVVGLQGLRAGEAIVTSGDGGLFPPGLLVGAAVEDGPGRWRVRLAAAAAPIDFVRLVPFARPVAPEAEPAADQGPPPPIVRPQSLAVVAAPPVPSRAQRLAQPQAASPPRPAQPAAPPRPAAVPPGLDEEEDAAPPSPEPEPPAAGGPPTP